MSTAAPFKALGVGNGFATGLGRFTGEARHELMSAPDLKQTMHTYWNIKKVSWGGAEFEPLSTPADLASDPKANMGGDSVGGADGAPRYSVSIGSPSIFLKDGKEYYCHGLRFNYRQDSQEGEVYSSRSVSYHSTFKTVSADDNEAYTCTPEYFTHGTAFGPSGSQTSTTQEQIGNSASSKNTTYSIVTISDIPFVKTDSFSFGGFSEAGCPNAGTVAAPGARPTLTFHTYT